MTLHGKKIKLLTAAQEAALLVVLFAFVLIVNYPIINFDMIYPEQALLYVANQKLGSWSDLLHLYLHPTLFAYEVPFFRPSGHFLMYQLIMPLLGWHNTRGLIVVSLGFLALTGYAIIKLYGRLFPQEKMGGYIACSLYLMYPALNLSRLTIMHFEFAYVFFILLSLYFFVGFCQRNHLLEKSAYHSQGQLVASLVFFVVAVTFKEPALMLGPVLLLYFFMASYHGSSLSRYVYSLTRNPQAWKVVLLILIMTVALGLYMTLSWPTLHSPTRNSLPVQAYYAAFISLVKSITNLQANFTLLTRQHMSPDAWAVFVAPLSIKIIIWCFLLLSLIMVIVISRNTLSEGLNNKKNILFIFLSSLIFLILPVAWAMGMPWHLSPTLAFLSLMMGFSFDYLTRLFFRRYAVRNSLGIIVALGIGLSAVAVNQANIHNYKANKDFNFVLMLNRNAVLFPPAIKNQLKPDSLIIEEDSRLHSDYDYGAAVYPLHLLGGVNYDRLDGFDKLFYLHLDPNFNGTLFRWAYLMPTLQEEVYPFRVSAMQLVPNEIIYNWLQQANNIFCLGYDDKADWQDKTQVFRRKLINERIRRHLLVHAYDLKQGSMMRLTASYVVSIPFPDVKLCQYVCDQDKLCTAFNYIDARMVGHRAMVCQFYRTSFIDQERASPIATRYLKRRRLL